MRVQSLTSGRPAGGESHWRTWLRSRAVRLRSLLGESAGDDGDDERHGIAGLGALFSFVVRVASALITFLAQVLMARWLGAHDFGIYTYVWVMVNVVGTLATFGLSMSAVRFLNEYMEHQHPALARGFLRFGRLLSFGMGLLAAAGGILLLHLFPDLIDEDFRLPLMIGLASLPAFALTDFHDGTGRARSWLSLAFVPPYILRPLLLLIFVGVGVWVFGMRTAWAAATALTLSTWLVAITQMLLQERRFRRELGGVRPAHQHRQWLAVSVPLLLLDSFTLLMTNVDVLLLKLFVEPSQIAIYFAAARVIGFVAFVHFAIVAVAMPRFATAYARNDIAAAARMLRRFRLWTFVPSLLAAALLLAIGPFVLALFGESFTAAWPVMAVLAVGYLARALAGPSEAMMAVSGKQTFTAVITGSTAALNIVLNIGLIPVFGLLGAGMATAGAFIYQALVFWLATRRLVRRGYDRPATNDPRDGKEA